MRFARWLTFVFVVAAAVGAQEQQADPNETQEAAAFQSFLGEIRSAGLWSPPTRGGAGAAAAGTFDEITRSVRGARGAASGDHARGKRIRGDAEIVFET